MSGSSFSIPNLARSGWNVTLVNSSPGVSFTLGSDALLMLEPQVCLNVLFLSAVSTVNFVEKTLQSLAPKPFLPPVTLASSSLKLEPVSR